MYDPQDELELLIAKQRRAQIAAAGCAAAVLCGIVAVAMMLCVGLPHP